MLGRDQSAIPTTLLRADAAHCPIGPTQYTVSVPDVLADCALLPARSWAKTRMR
jgi:hypothetical protein